MDDLTYSKLLDLLRSAQKVASEARHFRRAMLNSEIGNDYAIGEFFSVNAIEGSEFDFEIRCDDRTIVAHYSRFNKDEHNTTAPGARYQFLLKRDASPDLHLLIPGLLLQVEFGPDGKFQLDEKVWSCNPSSHYLAEMRNVVLANVVASLQRHIHESWIDIAQPQLPITS